jgi:hypothetical protein
MTDVGFSYPDCGPNQGDGGFLSGFLDGGAVPYAGGTPRD